MSVDTSVPLNYYTVFHHLNLLIPKDSIIVSEGANTMDIGRAMLPNDLPRHRLDAGTFGTMGVSKKTTVDQEPDEFKTLWNVHDKSEHHFW